MNRHSRDTRSEAAPGAVRLSDAALLGLAGGLLFGLLETLVLAFKKFVLHRYLHFNPQVAWVGPVAYAIGFSVIALFLGLLVPKARASWRLRLIGFTLGALGSYGVLFAMGGVHRGARLILGLGIGVQAMRWLLGAWPRVRNRLPTFAGVAAGLVLALGIGLNLAFRLGPRGGVGDNVPNVLWVIWDTVRSDNLSLYDYRRPTTPNLDRLARRGVTFDYASSPAPWTLPSHASMFTGLPPNALEAGWRTPLEKGPTTVAEIARAYGYRTGGFIANRFYVSRESGLSRGFSEWADYPVFTIPEFLRSTALARAAIGSSLNPLRLFRRAIEQESEEGAVAVGTPPTRPRPTRTSTAQRLVNWFRALQNESRKWAPKVNGEFLDWVTRDDARPYFAFLNYFDAHDPYRPPAPFDTTFGAGSVPQMYEGREYSPADIDRLINAYDASIAYLDHHFGVLLAHLDSLGLLDNTIVIVSSDHGEEFGEHRVFSHGHSLYQPSLRVPLVLVGPGVPAGRRIDEWVTTTELARTVLDLTGLEPRDVPGRSLARFWTMPHDSLALPADTLRATVLFSWEVPEWYPIRSGDMESLFADPWKYIRNGDGSEELYDLRADPGETTDMTGSEAGTSVLRAFRDRLPPIAPGQNGR